jgi:ubiquinone/menaquinone biosynthesis C-methylase UbiE
MEPTSQLDRVLEPEVMDTVEDAREYDAMDHREANAAFVDRLIELGAFGAVLDVGTGPGHIPLLLCERLPRAEVIGVDLSTYMLELAEEHRLASPNAARIEFRRADAKGLEFPDGSFDTVASNTILHHIPDPRPFLSEARRVLRPDGCLLIRDLYRPRDEAELERLVELHAAGATSYQRQLFAASLHAALTPAELREVAGQAGLADAEVVVDSDRHMSLQLRGPGGR